jgi:hypothetical protein
MKSNDEGMNTTVFALWTADFMTEGSIYTIGEHELFEKQDGPYMLDEVVKPFVELVFRARTVEANKALTSDMNSVT